MLTDAQRRLMDVILDELVPPGANGRIPGAGAAGVADFLLSASAYAPNHLQAVMSVIAAVSKKAADFSALDRTKRVAVLNAVETEEPESFATLVRLTYMGYYSRPDIRPMFGVGSHPVHPGGYSVERESDALMAELTEPVRARGEIYRV